MGDEVFFDTLQAWVSSNFNATGTTEEFLDLVEEKCGRDPLEFLDGVLHDPVIPVDPRFEEAVPTE